MHTLRSGFFSFPTLCAWGESQPCVSAVDTSCPPSALQDQMCLSLCGKQLRNTKPTRSSIVIFFNVFLQEPSSAMYRICSASVFAPASPPLRAAATHCPLAARHGPAALQPHPVPGRRRLPPRPRGRGFCQSQLLVGPCGDGAPRSHPGSHRSL